MTALLLTLLYFLVFNLLIGKFEKLRFAGYKPWVTQAFYSIKVLAGVALWAIYTFYYTDTSRSDIHKFYNDALVLHDLAKQHPGSYVRVLVNQYDTHSLQAALKMKHWYRNFDQSPFNENQTLIKLNSLLLFVSGKTYFVHSLFFCFVALTGWVFFYNSLANRLSSTKQLALLSVLLLPSVLLWSSGILKETLLVAGLGILLFSVINSERSAIRIAAFCFGALLMLFSKVYVLASFIPAVAAYFLLRKQTKPIIVCGKYLLVNGVLLLTAINAYRIMPAADVRAILMNKQENAIKEATYYHAGSQIDLAKVDNSISSWAKAAANGLLNVATRPYLWESKNALMLVSALENMAILGFVILCLYTTLLKKSEYLNEMLLLLNVCVLYFALIGMSTPVIGNLVRYKAPLLPLLMAAFMLPATWPDKYLTKLQQLIRA